MRKVDHDSRREEVAEAAAKLIAEKGMEGLTTRSLAKAMGCSIGVLSHYFSSKDKIVLAAFNWADSNIDRRIGNILKANPGLDAFIPVIRAGLPLTPESDIEWRVRFNLYTYTLSNSDDLVHQQEKMQNFRSIIYDLIKGLQERGELRNDIPTQDLTNLSFDVGIGAAQYLLMIPMDQREAYVETIFQMLESMRPSPTEPR
ncbi:MAG: TetR/AcrR family transcriptional regulator [Halioglobus sp.]